jgi:transcriptional regulator with XRE-family HTH domain
MGQSLGEKLRTLRKEKRFTLDALAEKVGISKSYLWELENRTQARPSAEILDRLAAELGVPISYFLDEDAAQPKEHHLDEAFFRNYQKLDATDKEQLRRILDTFRKPR